MHILDFRSDTVTKPTPTMRHAMAEAEVGDDVYSEDPTVNRLEAKAAEMLGFEAGLYMPSGTMTNQVALMLHLKRGQEVIAPKGAHIYEYEPGSLAVLSGGTIRLVDAPYGTPDPEAVRAAVHTSVHQAPTGLIELENTHNYAGGTVVPLEAQHAIQQVAQEAGLPIHLDGARLFNAATALNVSPAEVAKGFRTVSICLSKGLGAPVGSILLMPKEFRAEAWRYRKLLGGGMRQAGVLAAAGIIALTEGPKGLQRDHQMARALAEGMLELRLEVDLQSVQTNMVYVGGTSATHFAQRLAGLGLLANPLGSRVRFVTHRDLPDEAVPMALQRIRQALQIA
ncbi:MAG: threonine aldolase family protein [Thermaceae bacterium]|nr:threonine aldolase family protein [Thermaceae bacterium]